MQSITLPELYCIGLVHGDIIELDQAPKNYDISDHTGTLEIDPRFLDAMDGIKAGMTIVVLFWLHRSSRNILKVYPRGDRSRGLSGVFATRSPVRPNPIALSELTVLAVEGNCIQVRGLDVLDGTPIIDIKKKI
ncbi:MAG: tRNA (N6-threonylcarbamoyladenosine(37)-N6)-methyltransferase TrmO [Desulfobulbus sp.]|nr:tRNA (N6-threonylcarbamoyladenosine(37)-N6)-methyltransferase TrmO [Desulfobulbus sp.]